MPKIRKTSSFSSKWMSIQKFGSNYLTEISDKQNVVKFGKMTRPCFGDENSKLLTTH